MSNQLVIHEPSKLLAYLKERQSNIAMALPKHLNLDRMLRVALTCFLDPKQSKLRECTAQSILTSIVVASQLGLEPGINGQGYLIPYKQTCTFVPGWKGMVGLLNNSGRATAWTGSVFEGDVWEYELGSAPRCLHKPGQNFGDDEKLSWTYACGKVNGAETPVVEAWPVSRILKHRNKFNKVGDRHYSYTNWEMYARKVPLLQVLKYMPSSIELQNALTTAHAAEMGRTVVVENPGPGGLIIEADADDIPTVEDKPKEPAVSKKTEPTTPAQAATEAELKPAQSPQEKLAELVTSNGGTWESFHDWGVSTGNINEKLTRFDDLTDEKASLFFRDKRMLQAVTGKML